MTMPRGRWPAIHPEAPREDVAAMIIDERPSLLNRFGNETLSRLIVDHNRRLGELLEEQTGRLADIATEPVVLIAYADGAPAPLRYRVPYGRDPDADEVRGELVRRERETGATVGP